MMKVSKVFRTICSACSPYILLSLFFLCGISADAQTAASADVTISQAVREALANNLALLAERYSLSLADAQIVTAGLRPNPVLSAGGDHLDFVGTGFSEENGAGPPEYSVRVDWPFERGGKRSKRIELAEKAKEVARWQLLEATRKLVLEVQNAYVDVQLAKESLKLAEENLRSFNRVVEINTARVRSGDLAPVELTRTQIAALQFRNAAMRAHTTLRVASQRLQLLMGRNVPSPTFDVIGEPRRDSFPFKFEDIVQRTLDARPDLQALRSDLARSQADIKLQIANGKVDYSVGAEFRRQQGLAGKGSSLGFFVSIPLPVFNRNQGEIARAKEEEVQTGARIRALEADIRGEIRNAWYQYQTAGTLLSTIETEMLKQSRQVLETTEYTYRRGEAGLVDYLDAQRAFNDTMTAYIEARAEYARSLYQLETVSGEAPR